MMRFLAALGLLLVTLFIQIFLGASGIYLNIALAALVAFAFTLDLLELLVLDLIAVFILNWQPASSAALVAFALIPIGAYSFRRLTYLHGWVATAAAVVAGFLVFYIIGAPRELLHNTLGFFEDLVAGLAAGELVFFLVH